MAINRKYVKKVVSIEYLGEELATVRALTADDLREIMVRLGASVSDLLSTIEEAEFGDANKLTNQLLQHAPKLISTLSETVPDMLALIIAHAGDEPDAVDVIAEWPVPVQVEAAAEVFRLTFVDDEGFRKFVGNAWALVQSGNALTRNAPPKKVKTEAVQPSLADG